MIGQRLRKSQPWREIVGVAILQAARISILTTDENRGHTIVEYEIRVGVADVHQRVHVFVAQTHLNRCGVGDAEAVLRETVSVPLPQLHLWNARLSLLHRGK